MRSPQNFSSVGVHRSRFEYRALGLVSIIFPSFELGIAHIFFFVGFLILQGTLCQNLRICNWINQFDKFFFANRSTDSSGLLANDSVFGIFGALVQVGSSPSVSDRFGEWF